MATDTVERRTAHVRGVTVTAIACLAGVVAAVLSSAVAAGANDTLAIYILVSTIVVQFPLYRGLEMAGMKLDTEDFGAKDYLYVAFMTFSFWFVCWAILLETGASI